jgi:calmodulin
MAATYAKYVEPFWIRMLKKWFNLYGKQLYSIFKYIDKDEDNFIDKEELRTALIELDKDNFREEDVEVFLAYSDLDENGRIDYSEFSNRLVQLLLSYSPDNKNFAKLRGKLEKYNREKLRVIFNELDTDGSGFLDRVELRNALIQLDPENFKETDVDELLKLTDRNNDGKLDYKEFIEELTNALVVYYNKWSSAHTKHKDLDDKQLKTFFKTMDKNGDGHISLTEFCEAMKAMDPKNYNPDDAEVLFQYADVDENGLVDYEEFTDHLVSSLRKYLSLDAN